MKLGLLGDIHGNAAALTAALAGAHRESVEHLILTGDYVGYYYSPEVVLDLLDQWPCTMVKGNHEDMLVQALRNPSCIDEYTRKYGHGLQVAIQQLSQDRLRQLEALPDKLGLELDGLRFLVAHGTPWEPDAYLYPNAPETMWDRFAEVDADIVVLGHTHYSMSREVFGKLILNPGSVGQPRDRQPGAAWALFDTASQAYSFFREPYDAGPVRDIAAQLDPGLPYLQDVLARV